MVSSSQKRGEEHLEDLRAADPPPCEQAAVRVHPSVATDASQMFPWKGVPACRAGPLNMLRRKTSGVSAVPPEELVGESEDVLGVCEEEQQPASPSSPPAASCSELHRNLGRPQTAPRVRPCDPQETLPPRVFTCARDSVCTVRAFVYVHERGRGEMRSHF